MALVAAGAATVQLIAGFGFALAAVPLFSLVIDPHDAVIVSLGIATLTNGYQAWAGRRDRRPRRRRGMLAGAAVGLPIGWLIYLWADDRVLGIVIGVAVLGVGRRDLPRPRPARTPADGSTSAAACSPAC